MKKCEKCWKEFDDAYFHCPYCGKRYKDKKTKQMQEAVILSIVVVVFAVLIFVSISTFVLKSLNLLGNEEGIETVTEETLDQKNARKVKLMRYELQEDGWLCFTSGHTFDECTTVARKYLRENENEEFYATAAVVSTKNATVYYVSGFTKTGKPFDVSVIHYEDVWMVYDGTVYPKE